MEAFSNKRIITVATTGAWPQKDNNPSLPTQPEEIVEAIYNCWRVGAAIAHIHIRDENDQDSMDPNIFSEVLDRLQKEHPDCDIICNLTAAGGIGNSESERMKPFQLLKPEIASFDCGTMNWMHIGIFNNNPQFLMKMGKEMQNKGVKPEVEVFDIGDIWEAKWYTDRGYIKKPVHFQFCMGCPGGIPATAENVILMKNALKEALPDSTWSAFGIGRGATAVMYTAIAAGGNIRVGMEDNIFYKKGQLAESNMQLVERARRCIEDFGLEIATANEARQILSL